MRYDIFKPIYNILIYVHIVKFFFFQIYADQVKLIIKMSRKSSIGMNICTYSFTYRKFFFGL